MRTVAERKGYNFFMDWEVWCGHGLFNVDFGVIDGECLHSFSDTVQMEFNPAIFDVEDFTTLEGFFPSEKYFDHDKARQWFKPILDVSKLYDYNNTCFMHFRGKDYNRGGWEKYQLPNAYYEEAGNKMLAINSDLKFVFVTDDKGEVKKRFPGDEVISTTSILDFAILNKAKYIVISNSSFSWWAAWLNLNNVVIAPAGWLNYNIDKTVFSPADIKVERFNWI
jgi:hypothetical protein